MERGLDLTLQGAVQITLLLSGSPPISPTLLSQRTCHGQALCTLTIGSDMRRAPRPPLCGVTGVGEQPPHLHPLSSARTVYELSETTESHAVEAKLQTCQTTHTHTVFVPFNHFSKDPLVL